MSDPLQSGLSAGQAAYSGAAPKRMGISAADLSSVRGDVTSGLQTAAAQRKVLDTNAAKQAAGAYPTSGTSAAMYNYLRGQGGYPVNAVPSNQPVNTGGGTYGGTGTLPSVTRPPIRVYEDPTKTVKTQTDLATKAKTDPTKMGKVTQPTVNMPKPTLMQTLMATAGPAALGYYALNKSGGLDALGRGWDSLFGGSAANMGTATGADLSAFYDWGPATAAESVLPTVDASSIQALYENNPYMDWGAPVTTAETGITGATGVVSDSAIADAGLASAIDAGGAGLTGTVTGADLSAAYDLGAAGGAGGAEAGAAAAGATDYAALAAEYGPYVAAAYIADQVLLDGAISEGISDVVQGAGNVVEDVVGGAGDLVEDVVGGCYITTAATKHGGQKDDGEVLNTLRRFRDTYMRKDAEKNKDVAWYYKNAPKIVNAIDKMPEADAVYQKLYKQYILPAYHAIKKGENKRAFKLYKSLVKHAESVAGLHRGKELTKRYADGGNISVGSRYDPNIDGISQATPNMAFQPTVGRFAAGGISHLGDYSDGGRLLKGPGDGVSDSIPATIGGKQPARLADGEFVIPARIVSEIGNGSTEAGARKLYAMMDRVQAARRKTVGKGKVAKNTRADKYLPK